MVLFRNNINELMIGLDKNLNTDYVCNKMVEELEEENKNMKSIIDLSNTINYEYVVSKVKYRDVLDFHNTIKIYKGSNDNIKEQMAVINEQGLIGVIKSTDKNTSIVDLITSKSSNISVRINDSFGILKMENNKLIVDSLTNYDALNINDEIYTSGIGNLPGNILIGTVRDIIMDGLEIEKRVIVKESVDFNNINYCIVIGGL